MGSKWALWKIPSPRIIIVRHMCLVETCEIRAVLCCELDTFTSYPLFCKQFMDSLHDGKFIRFYSISHVILYLQN